MKKMNFIWLILIGLATGFASCSKNEINPEDDSALMDFLFLATASDSTGVRGPHGKCDLTAMDVASLPSAIVAYVTATYAGSTIGRAGKTSDGMYALQITKADGTKAGLIFDATGAFVKEHGGKGKGLKGTGIAVADLPSGISAFITATYAGSTIEKAIKSEDGRYGVLLTKSDETKVLLGFDADGKFIAELSLKGKGGKKSKRK
jgi:hypothetical protein